MFCVYVRPEAFFHRGLLSGEGGLFFVESNNYRKFVVSIFWECTGAVTHTGISRVQEYFLW